MKLFCSHLACVSVHFVSPNNLVVLLGLPFGAFISNSILQFLKVKNIGYSQANPPSN